MLKEQLVIMYNHNMNLAQQLQVQQGIVQQNYNNNYVPTATKQEMP